MTVSPSDAKAVLHGGIVLLAHEVVIPQGVVWPQGATKRKRTKNPISIAPTFDPLIGALL